MNHSTVLLHCCCAVCASSCIERLLAEGKRVVLFYSNSNIAPPEEFERRLAALRKLAEIHQLSLYVDPPDHAAWLRHIAGYEDAPERGARCPLCFRFSLARTAAKAAELGIEAFTTSLTVSPHKNSRVIFACGAEFPGFAAYDFKKKKRVPPRQSVVPRIRAVPAGLLRLRILHAGFIIERTIGIGKRFRQFPIRQIHQCLTDGLDVTETVAGDCMGKQHG